MCLQDCWFSSRCVQGLTRHARHQEAAGGDKRVVRVMPNTPCLVGETASAMCLGGRATEEDAEVVRKLFSAVGRIVQVRLSRTCTMRDAIEQGVPGLTGVPRRTLSVHSVCLRCASA